MSTRLLRLPAPPATAAPTAATRRAARPPTAAPAARREPQAITVTPAPEAAPAEPITEPAPGPVAVEIPASVPAPLNLRLPRRAPGSGTARNPALDDPRGNTPHATMEERLAAAMGGDGRWVMERLDGDRIRYRRGNQCVDVQRTRAGQLELANGAFRNLWAAKPC